MSRRFAFLPFLPLTIAAVCSIGSAASPQATSYQQGVELFRTREYARAADVLATAEREAPRTTDALLIRTKALVHLNRYEEAEQSVRAFLEGKPTAGDARFLLGYVLFRRNQPRESLAAYTAAAAMQRPRPDDFKIVGLDYVLLNDYPEAIRWLERSVAEDPRDAEAVYYLGRGYYAQNWFDKAIAAFRQSLQIDPHFGKAQNNLGLALAAQNHLEEAESAYRSAIRLDEENGRKSAQPYINLSELLIDGNRVTEALPLLNTARAIDAKSEKLEQLRGRALASENRLDEAEAAFRAALAINPESGSLHYQLARVLNRLKRDGEAKQEFERSRSLLGTRSSAPSL